MADKFFLPWGHEYYIETGENDDYFQIYNSRKEKIFYIEDEEIAKFIIELVNKSTRIYEQSPITVKGPEKLGKSIFSDSDKLGN